MRGNVERWRGGFVRRDGARRPVFYISKRMGGVRFEISTRCDREDAAEEHYARFLKNPAAYSPVGEALPEEPPLVLDEALARRFLEWSKDVKGNTDQWVACQRQQLAWWSEKWGDTTLRVHGGDEAKRLWMKDHVQKPLEGTKGQQQRVAVLSAFFGWLRRVALELSPSSDPTFGMLSRPAPYKPSSTKDVITQARFLEIRAELDDGPYLWAFDVIIGTGRHVREVRRFAETGAVEPLPDGRPNAREGLPLAAEVLTFGMTKAGVPAWVPVSKRVADSARKLIKHGTVPPGKYGKGWEQAVLDGCLAADVTARRVPAKFLDEYGAVAVEHRNEVVNKGLSKPFHVGWVRRTVRTFAGSKGASGPECDDFLGHAKRTGERHYGRHVPFKIATMI